jgi:N-acetyl-gamma-glutamyl-phosphate reductase
VTTIAIIGAAGYAGEELLRLLTRHPDASISCITSRQYAGQGVETVFPRFQGSGLTFSAPDVDAIVESADVAILALPHGLAAEYAVPLVNAGVKVIDISADFRLRDTAVYKTYYKVDHPAPQLLDKAVYGLPERYRDALKGADLVACPGCYPTSTILPTAPVLASGLVSRGNVLIASLSGVSGAGRKIDLPYLFAECNESVRPYGVVGHRHTPEIEQELTVAAGESLQVSFVPHLVPITRGMHSTIFLDAVADCSVDAVHEVLTSAYADESFVRVLPLGTVADSKNVTQTNVCEIGCAYDPRTGRVILSSAIDNLTKGASGQAVQCLNIICGYPETAGLV